MGRSGDAWPKLVSGATVRPNTTGGLASRGARTMTDADADFGFDREEMTAAPSTTPEDRLSAWSPTWQPVWWTRPTRCAVSAERRGQSVHLNLRVPESELGKVIGRQGRDRPGHAYRPDDSRLPAETCAPPLTSRAEPPSGGHPRTRPPPRPSPSTIAAPLSGYRRPRPHHAARSGPPRDRHARRAARHLRRASPPSHHRRPRARAVDYPRLSRGRGAAAPGGRGSGSTAAKR